jgi:hypothetical protein
MDINKVGEQEQETEQARTHKFLQVRRKVIKGSVETSPRGSEETRRGAVRP